MIWNILITLYIISFFIVLITILDIKIKESRNLELSDGVTMITLFLVCPGIILICGTIGLIFILAWIVMLFTRILPPYIRNK